MTRTRIRQTLKTSAELTQHGLKDKRQVAILRLVGVCARAERLQLLSAEIFSGKLRMSAACKLYSRQAVTRLNTGDY